MTAVASDVPHEPPRAMMPWIFCASCRAVALFVACGVRVEMYWARERWVRFGSGEGEVRSFWEMVMALWAVGVRLMSIKRTVALLDSIWAFV